MSARRFNSRPSTLLKAGAERGVTKDSNAKTTDATTPTSSGGSVPPSKQQVAPKTGGLRLPQLQGNEVLVAAAALALLIIIPQVLTFFFYNAENAFIGFMLGVEQSILRLLFLAFRSFGLFAAIAGAITLAFFGIKSKLSSYRSR